MARILLGTFNAASLSAFTRRTGPQTIWQEGDTFYVSGQQDGQECTEEVPEGYIVHRMLDTHPAAELSLTPAGEVFKARYA